MWSCQQKARNERNFADVRNPYSRNAILKPFYSILLMSMYSAFMYMNENIFAQQSNLILS